MSDSFNDDLKLPPEQQAILDKCFHPSGKFIEFPKEDVEASISERFEKIVGRFPDRPAVKIRNRTLRYQELNHAANRLAHAILAQRGKMPEPVALLMEHDSQLIVAIVGALKAGKICVVLDPSFPKARSSFLLEDSQAGLLITDNKNLSLAREYAHDRCRIVNIDELDSGFSIDNPGLSISPDHFAFLVYTSGSTGQPKGVIQNHRNLLHDGLLYCNGLHICPDDRVALLYSCGASQGLKITFATLLSGAALHPFNVQQKGVADLALWLNREEITIYFSIPIIFRQFVGTITGQAQLPRLRIIQLGSDLVTPRELEDYQQHFSADTILIIRFGTTETGTLRRMFFNVEAPFEETTVPVGYATEDSHVSLLDEEGKEVKFDTVGEIVVESRYISPGYWRRPDLTRETFFSDPTGGDKRIYHTGDLGRLRSDGLLYHLGRKDFQLNIRGYRVEAGEIEAVLLAQDNVKEALVATGKGAAAADGDRLIAYIVPFERPWPSTALLRRGVGAKLPAYMIPSDFVFLESLPHTPNGKIDRQALPAPDRARPELETTYIAPQSALEKQLAQIWTEVLSITPVGVHDNFFDLGGHSLSATRLVSQVIERFQLEIPQNTLFQSPTVAEMAAVITGHQERDLSDSDGEFDGTAPFSLRPMTRDRNLPLSFAQQRLWFLNQLEPDSPVYNQGKALKLRGRLNREALQKALDTIVERHGVLRTTFSSVDGKPIQIIHDHGKVEFSALDLIGIPIEQQEEELHRLMGDFTRRPFDLEKDWPLRAALIRWAAEECVLIFVTHHIASDGWSNNILFRELSALYEAFCQGKASPLKDLPIQYADYAVWQKEWLQGEVLQQQLSYWEKQLKEVTPLELPTDHPRPAVVGHLGRTKTFKFPGALAQDLKNLSRQEHVTLFMTLLAAFQTLLHRYTGQDDIVVGSPIAGRTRVEVEGLIGFFVNTLVLRIDLSGNPTFRELLARVRKNALDAYSHQDVPFEKLVEELQPERDLGHNPFFQVMFQLRNYPTQSVSLGDLNIEEHEFDSDIAKFDLSVALRDDVTGLAGSIEYRTDLFDQTTIERMIGHFQTLLEGIAVNPEQAISELPLLTEAEKHQLLVDFNDAKTDYPKDKCIQELFETQVEKTPDAIAVVFEDERLTYQELNRRANQLAHCLRKHGVGPEVLVGICIERSLEMIVGILGILKAGGAYVPLDPSYPEDRLAFMLEDTKAAVLITQSSLIERLPAHNATVLCLDRDWGEISEESQDNPLPLSTPDSLAYVIYTSGSTGIPKGTLIAHHNVVRLFFATRAWFSFAPEDVWTLFHSYAFDFSVWEIWGALLHGGRLVIVTFEVSRSPHEFYELLCREQVTVLNQTPSAFRQLVGAEESIIDPSRLGLRLVIFGGEALDFQSLKPWFDRHGDQRPQLINMYGITETTVHVTYRMIKEADLSAGQPSLIGVPIPDLELYVLDPHRQLVPVGVAGELYVGGAGLARGYLNRGELTAERFVSHPFDEGNGKRLYRSGDLVRRRADGDIEYVGRIDNQVKIRGHRIELGEIEAVLAQHAAIQQAVVLAREDSEDRRLVAYVVAAAGYAPSVNELRGLLQQKLPEYMVPSAMVFLEILPLTLNGKVDRKALPAPAKGRPELGGGYVAPRTPTEELLAGIVVDVLKLDQVGIHDNFFELGVHSLLATQVISRIGATCQAEIPLRFLFERSTIAGLAERIEQYRRQQQGLQTIPMLAVVSRDRDLPLSFAQQRLWFLDRLEPGSATYNVPAAFRLVGDLKVQALEQSLDEIVRRHEVLRTIFPTINGDPVQRILLSSSFSLTHVDIGDCPASEHDQLLSELLREEAERPFDLSQGPLLRVTLVRLAPQDHVLSLNMHHIISDGWSMGVLFRELSALYRAYCAGKPSPLPALPIQYADYSVWQRDWLHDENLASQLSYWTKQLDNLTTLQLPTDRARPAVQTYRGSSQIVDLSAQLTEAIKAIGQQEGVTLFMTLLAAFELLLSRYCGQSDIAVGSPIAGRTRQETEGLIGFFANTLVLRADLSNNPTFNELLRQIRETTLEAYSHQDLPFEKLVEELHPDRNLSKSPLFQVMFVFQNAADQRLEFERLRVDPIRMITHNAKFELLLSLSDKDGKLGGSLNYNTDLFDAATIERMIGHFQTLLERIVANPERPISELPLLTESERQRLLVEWNDTRTDYPKDRCIHELFENQVEKTPDAIALVFEDQQLTYRELNNRANRLAHYFQKLGVGAEVPVGICLERSVELAIGLLAVLKAGGVYVPLDPTYPPDRLALMLQDTQAPLIVSVQSVADQLSSHGAQSINLETTQQGIAREDHSNPRLAIATDSPAYVLYTSGSTGKPKGVVMGHGALTNLISWQVESFSAPLPARTLQFAPLGFDVSIQEMLATWCSGGSLFLIKDELRRDGLRLLRYLREQSVERIFLPFIALQHLADAAAEGNFFPLSLREIITAGEQLQLTESLRSFLNRLGDCCLRNQYGPTESHVVTEYTLKPPFERWPDLPPIGRPIANAEIYTLDSHLNPVPIGIAGEIYIGGVGVARGYLNRPELTAEKFIANPFSADPTSRLYKTGDLARHLADGNIEFLGRMDDQVKIRGYRIELGEIETVLGQHSSLREAVVLAREDSPGDRRLVAYVVAAAGAAPSANDLRSFLQAKLPEYMVPSVFVFLDSLPLTPNGKLDRKALPAPDQTRPELGETFVAPRTPVEETLASIWAAVLKLDKVGIHDNFFELGGHSLLATQLFSRIREAFKFDLPLRSLFEAPTIYGLAQRLQELGEKQDVRPGTKITPVAREQYRVQQTK